MQSQPNARRSYGTGRLYVRTDRNGRESYYGSFYVNGRRVNRKIGPKRERGGRDGLTQREAEKRLRQLMVSAVPSRGASGTRIGIEDASEAWMVHLRHRGRKHATIVKYESVLQTHLVPFFRGKSLDAIRYEDVVDLMADLSGRGRTPKTIRNVIGVLSALCNYAKAPQRRWISSNPCEGVELPAIPERVEIRFLTLDEVRRLVAAVRPGPFEAIDRAIFLTAAMTGLRLGELLALRWRDVDWTAQQIRVRRNYTRNQFGTPKSRRGRNVPLADEVAGELDRLYKQSRFTAEDDLVFGSPVSGGPIPNRPWQQLQAILEAAGLGRHAFHDLRHTFGTRMAAAGVPLRTLQEWMGHAHIETTMIYAGYSPSRHEAEMVAAAFSDDTPLHFQAEIGTPLEPQGPKE